MIRAGLLALALPCATPAVAQGILLQSPIDCDLTRTCFIQQYVDRDPGPGARDFRCASLSYDGHKGTDFALRSTAQMQTDVRVLASASGTVKGIRDGMVDRPFREADAASLEGRDCGNGVVVDHGDGWETQYCHLKQGSVTVEPGQRIEAGTPLGYVGQSGRAAFPHVHLSVRNRGEVVDPFDPDGTLNCDESAGSTLWQEAPVYRPGGLLDVGFTDHVPQFAAIKAGDAQRQALSVQAPALVIYGYYFGSRAGDTVRLTITGPDGTVIEDDVALEKTQAQGFRAIGKKRRGGQWPAGSYDGAVSLFRDGTVIDSLTAQITLN